MGMGGYVREIGQGRVGMEMKSVGTGVISVPMQVSTVIVVITKYSSNYSY